uniref:Formin-like protein 18 isoform X3 n=1 Tax=Phascolarctos cinereus TaxID=38626 RepID=A0A6P5KEK2_PHACI|nr:formin-like protein 18 isoform X3 [Phascolarctos cinereus]
MFLRDACALPPPRPAPPMTGGCGWGLGLQAGGELAPPLRPRGRAPLIQRLPAPAATSGSRLSLLVRRPGLPSPAPAAPRLPGPLVPGRLEFAGGLRRPRKRTPPVPPPRNPPPARRGGGAPALPSAVSPVDLFLAGGGLGGSEFVFSPHSHSLTWPTEDHLSPGSL